MNNTNTVNWMAAAVARYEFCSAKIKRAEALNQSQATIDKWYREMFRAEDRMRALGI
jgi:hypothetical protein